MNILLLIPDFLRVLSNASGTFLHSQSSTTVQTVLSAGAALIERGNAAATDLTDLTAHLKAMGASDPTDADWAQLKARSDAAHAALQSPGS